MSAVAARRARQQQQAQNVTPPKNEVDVEIVTEPPPKRPRRSSETGEAKNNDRETRVPRTRSSKKEDAPLPTEIVTGRQKKATRSNQPEIESPASQEQDEPEGDEGSNEGQADGPEDMTEDEVASVAGDADGYESPADIPAEVQNFPLSKARLNKNNVVYADEGALCVRVKEKMVCVKWAFN